MNKKHDPVISKIDFDNKDVFEIGFGTGSFSLEHFLSVKSVYGIDTSQEAVEYRVEKWPVSQENQQFLFQEGNIVEITLDEKIFDIVVFSNSF
jgi:ubiquinone/menaquinone biosynthesis C-methylase UbiE